MSLSKVETEKPPITYIQSFVVSPDAVFEGLKGLDWERRETTPRSEYYINEVGNPYTYGVGRGQREYLPRPNHPFIEQMQAQLLAMTGFKFEVCFLNRYHNQSDHLGWHADDSPEMDDARPIAIVSLGVEREIWFCPNTDKTKIYKQILQHGSLCLMHPQMQNTHLHRIPKAGFNCGERISLTFRGYVSST